MQVKYQPTTSLIYAALLTCLALPGIAVPAPSDTAPGPTAEYRLTGDLKIEISGVKDNLATNIQANLSAFGYTGERIISSRRMASLRDNSIKELHTLLQPFGYYHPRAEITVSTTDTGWFWKMEIEKGPPVLISELDLQVSGEGSELKGFQQWLQDWPLPVGSRLVHSIYEQAKQSFGQQAELLGFFDYKAINHEVLVDANTNEAIIHLYFETGPQFVFGDISIESEALTQKVLDRFYLIDSGEPYTAAQMEAMRKVISSSLYFKHLNTETEIDRESLPPRVNVSSKPELRERNRYKATLGYGTDKGARTQLGWERRLISSRGDRLVTGLGLQQQYAEITFRTDYKLPISTETGQFFIATGQYLYQNDEFSFIDDDSNQAIFPAVDGPRNTIWLRAGKLSEFWPLDGSQPLSQTLFLGFLNEDFDALGSTTSANDELIKQNPELEGFLRTSQTNLVLGAEWDWLNMKGTGYATRGIRSRARVLLANESLGSDVSYEQAYIGSRLSLMFGERLKLTVRGELGYTNAPIDTLLVNDGNEEVELSITRLPNQFRFKAGGTYSVRGYGFESLSNNQNGSNNLITASTELEYLVGDDWSVAAFADIGNAFNDYSRLKLKAGVGIGLRYYTIVGPVRLDFAFPLDDFDNSLRIHFALGVPILNIGRVLP